VRCGIGIGIGKRSTSRIPIPAASPDGPSDGPGSRTLRECFTPQQPREVVLSYNNPERLFFAAGISYTIAMPKTYAVLTGDLVGSTKASPEDTERAMATLQAAARDIERWIGSEIRFTRFRGDGWQVLLDDPRFSLRAVVALLAELAAARTGLETRIAIGFGPIDRSGTSSLSDAYGEAFSVSGQALDAMTRGKHIALAGPVVEGWHEALFGLTVWTASRWTAAQAEAVALLVQQKVRTQADMAPMLSISQQAVNKRLSTAGWEQIAVAIGAVQEYDWGAGRD
jgi:hypothetical protein